MESVLTPSVEIHRDLRSESVPYKRDKEASSRWALNAYCTGHGFLYLDPQEAEEMKSPLSFPAKGTKVTGNFNTHKDRNYVKNNLTGASNRVFTRRSAQEEIMSAERPGGLSSSMLALLPTHSPRTSERIKVAAEADAGITYSFDAPRGPSKTVGLDALVQQAEAEFYNRETEKIVRSEWEALDGEGEKVVLSTAAGKKGRKSPKTKPVTVKEAAPVEDDDYELI